MKEKKKNNLSNILIKTLRQILQGYFQKGKSHTNLRCEHRCNNLILNIAKLIKPIIKEDNVSQQS